MILASVMLGMLLAALDQTIVGTAMPRVIAELQGLEHYTWVFTAYMLAATVSVPIYGKLSDIFGRRPFFLIGMAVFLLGSGLSGLSQDMTQLIVFRAVQGLGAGAMMPLAQAIIGDLFPPAERGKWQGLLMGVFGLASIVGPITGGWITDNWGWRWTFYVNMPVGALALLTASLALPGQSRRSHHRIDYRGAAVLIAAAVPMLLAFSWAGTEYPWESVQIIGLLAFSALMWITLFLAETRAPEPMINPALFRSRIFTMSVIATFLTSVGMFGTILFLPLFLQGVVGESATNSGAVLTPMMLAFIASAAVGGQIMSRTGRYKGLALGSFAVGAVGMYLLSRMDASATQALVAQNMVITGLGIGVMMTLFTIVVQNAVSPRMLGEVTGNLQFFRAIGGTIGVAILGTVMTNRFQDELAANMPPAVATASGGLPAGALGVLGNPQALLSPEATAVLQQSFLSLGPQGATLFDQFLTVLQAGLASAITDVFGVGAGAMILGLLATVFLPEIPLRGRRGPVPVDGRAPLPQRESKIQQAAQGGGTLLSMFRPRGRFRSRQKARP
ncbi:MAG: DHA2 family efflux MFS transporter permease subunit [Chloroflexi bacterium]|nr:DHA2 family efflux MFS transporter permease subunit [Chloroflexota bacterium]